MRTQLSAVISVFMFYVHINTEWIEQKLTRCQYLVETRRAQLEFGISRHGSAKKQNFSSQKFVKHLFSEEL